MTFDPNFKHLTRTMNGRCDNRHPSPLRTPPGSMIHPKIQPTLRLLSLHTFNGKTLSFVTITLEFELTANRKTTSQTHIFSADQTCPEPDELALVAVLWTKTGLKLY